MKLLFFLNAYPSKSRFVVILLLLVERLLIFDALIPKFFGRNLIESRRILGFIYESGGKASPHEDAMKVTFRFLLKDITLKLRWHSSDFLVFEQVFIREEYKGLSEQSPMPRSIVDAGANIGCTSIYLKILYPEASILAVEPDEKNFRALKENIELCGLTQVACLRQAVWKADGTVFLGTNYRDKREWSVKIEERGQSVACSTLLTLIHTWFIGSIDMLKMDIEGAELDIFRDDSNLEEVLMILKHIAIEVHDDTEDVIRQTLILNGFRVYFKNETLFGERIS